MRAAATGGAGTRAAAVAALLLVAAPLGPAAGSAAAQEAAPEAILDSVAAAADAGRLERARGLLERWRSGPGREAGSADRRRAEFLAARLTADADSARRLYARLAVEEGGELAVRARLRLAQLHLAEGDPEPALRQLELVRADVPGDTLAAESWLWTGRARLTAGDSAGACEALARAARAGAPLRRRAARVGGGCGLDGELAAAPEAAGETTEPAAVPDEGEAADEPADDTAGAPDEGEAADDAAGGAGVEWAVQLGAFRDPGAAERVARRAREAGWEARTLPPGDDGLHRVRVGGWPGRSGAEEAAGRIEEDGFRVLVVKLRNSERRP